MLGFYDYTVVLTYLSLFSSVLGLFFSMNGHPYVGCFCLLFCGLFDAFDGRVARTKADRTEEEMRYGIQIDSLSDLVAFGVLPGAIGYGLAVSYGQSFAMELPLMIYLLICCLYALAALIRLAYFNVQEEHRQEETTECRHSYNGLPVTSAAAIFPGLAFLLGMKWHQLPVLPVYGTVLLVVSVLFVAGKLHIRKPSFRGLMLIVLLGALEALLLALCLGL